MSDTASRRALDTRKQRRNQCDKVIDAVGPGRDENNRDAEFGQMLLKGEIAVDGDEHVELSLSEPQKLTVGESSPPMRCGRRDRVTANVFR
jgi:hypothetical protein